MSVSPLFDREYKCPVCRTIFKSPSVRSSAAVVTVRESDFHVCYRHLSPLHYAVVACPACGYSASASAFGQEIPRPALENLVSHLKENGGRVRELNRERSLPEALACWEMAVDCARWKNSTAAQMAGLLLGAAWLCRENGMSEKERDYMEQALDAYARAFNDDPSPIGGLDDLNLTYLIGELNRRLGNYNEAVSWFNRVIRNPAIKKNPGLENLTREQWQESRSQAKEAGPETPGVAPAAPPVSAPAAPAAAPAPPVREAARPPVRRVRVQMNAHMYYDQVEWLKKVVNAGYGSSGKLVTREEVLRALLDAAIDVVGDRIPSEFTGEEELAKVFSEILSTPPARQD